MWTLLLCLSPAHASAFFDQVAEGWTGTTWTEGGVTVTNLDNRLDPPPGSLTIERAVANLTGMPGYSSPNVLGFGGYVPGDGTAFGRFGSVDIVPNGVRDAARVEVFTLDSSGLPLRLEAWRRGALVGQDEVRLQSPGAIMHYRLEVGGAPFDHLRLVADPAGGQAVFISIDNVVLASLGGDTGDTDQAVDTDLPADSDPDTDVPEGGDDTDPVEPGADDDTDDDTDKVTEPDRPDTDVPDTDVAPADTDPSDTPATDDPTDRPEAEDKATSGCSCNTGSLAPPAWLLLLAGRRRGARR